MEFSSKIAESVKYISQRLRSNPAICILIRNEVLDLNYVGSIHQKISLQDIPHCDKIPLISSMSIYEVTIEGVSVLLYETPHQILSSYDRVDLLYPIHSIANLGIRCLLSIDSLECIATDLNMNDLFVISDHINLTGINPLEQVQFTSDYFEKIQHCSISYSKDLTEIFKETSESLSFNLKKGLMIGAPNPLILSSADKHVYKTFQSDCIGSIHVLESIVARYYGMVLNTLVVPKLPIAKNNSTLLNERRQMINGILNFILPKIYQYLATNSNELY